VEAKKCGISSVGCDAHPFAVLVSRVKTNWSLDIPVLNRMLRRIVAKSEKQMFRHSLPSLSLFTEIVGATEPANGNGYSLNRDEEKLLPAGFLSERPLQRLMILRTAIKGKA